MSSYILFLLLGLGSGAVYGMLALGLVLKHRSGGVVDFGHGAVAMFIAYVYLGLRQDGTLELPWLWLPHSIDLGGAFGTWPAIVVSLVYAAVFGAVLYVLIYRPLRGATALTRVCASVGTMLALQAIAVLNFGTTAKSTPAILPNKPFRIGDITVPVDRLWFAGIVVVLAILLGAAYRFTRFGLATRASAENEQGAALVGLNADRIALWNWVLATILAGVAGILIAPVSTVDPTSYTLFIVPALGCALLARFTSFGIAAGAGLVLGMLQSEITKLISVASWLPQEGLPQALPFVLIVLAMTLMSRGVGARGVVGELKNPSLGRPTRPWSTALMCFVLGTIALVVLSGSLRVAMTASICTVCMAMSLVVLTGYVGQVSLAQMSFAGIGAFEVTHLFGPGTPFIITLLCSALVAVPLGLLIGLPALRVRGVNLAVVTLAAAFALDALVFNNDKFSGGLAGRDVASPRLFGLDVGIAHGDAYPRVIFGVVALAIVCLVGVFVARLRNGAAGRMFIAVRSNERAASAIGIDVARTKLMAFGLSAFIAGLGGGLLAYQQQTVSSPSFATFASLSLLAVTYVAGVGRIAGAVVAGVMLSSTGLFVTALDKAFGVGKYQLLVAGVALTLTAIKQPDGIAATPPPPLVKLWHMIMSRWEGRGPSKNGATPSTPSTPSAPPAAVKP
jgi:ABC-type branched-subunit amino acid transport system permease subunit